MSHWSDTRWGFAPEVPGKAWETSLDAGSNTPGKALEYSATLEMISRGTEECCKLSVELPET